MAIGSNRIHATAAAFPLRSPMRALRNTGYYWDLCSGHENGSTMQLPNHCALKIKGYGNPMGVLHISILIYSLPRRFRTFSNPTNHIRTGRATYGPRREREGERGREREKYRERARSHSFLIHTSTTFEEAGSCIHKLTNPFSCKTDKICGTFR